jgi:HEAT repeat protein
LNAIYALKLQFDVRAITRLVELVDDKEPQVASAVRDTLRSMGIPVDGNASSRAKILTELRTRGMERFQRDWIVQQESRVSALQKERDTWRNQYLGALDRIYDGLADEGQRGKLLTEQLGSPEAAVRLWALEKVSQWRVGTQPKLPAEIGPVLVKLISDNNRDVRLATAKLLSLTGELGSAERMAEQFKAEQDEQVKLELFIALGSACHYALVPTSGIQLSAELRKQTLEWALQYLNDDDGKKAYNGAEVIRKLLEPGGIPADDAAVYLDMLVERYNRELKNSEGTLRGELLGTMARLCGQSTYKPESAKRFAALFEKALNDENSLVRETAVDGLICIDKPRALRILAKSFLNDRSQIIRSRIMELAAEVGSEDDLQWLWDKTGTNSESKTAWQAMLKIFNGCGVDTVEKWLGKFDSQEDRSKLADDQWIAFLELAERKAAADNRAATVRKVREKLARLYIVAGQYPQAAECLGKLRETAQTTGQKDAILGQLMEVYLRWPKVEAASRLVGNCLLGADLGENSAVIRSIEAFWDKPAGGADPNEVLESFRKIKPDEDRPKWEQQMARWTRRFGQAKKVEEPNVSGGRGGD